MNKKLFHLLLKYMDAKFYAGHIRRLLMRKVPYKTICCEQSGYRNEPCVYCGNIANGLATMFIGHHRFVLPVCKSHVVKLNDQVESAPFHIQITAQQFTSING